MIPYVPDPSGETLYLTGPTANPEPGVFVSPVRVKPLRDALTGPEPQACDWAYASIPPSSPNQLRPTWALDAPTPELQEVASAMVGRWQGTQTTQLAGPHQVQFAFFANGLFSAVCPDAPALGWGAQCFDHRAYWRLTTGSRALASGDLGGGVSISDLWMDAQRLTFDVWDGMSHGKAHITLTRVP